MLNPFPELLTFSLLAPFILRLGVGFVFLRMSWHTLAARKNEPMHPLYASVALVSIAASASVLVGVFTQVAAAVLLFVALGTGLHVRKHSDEAQHLSSTYFLLALVSLSLVFSGAGAFAFDLPL